MPPPYTTGLTLSLDAALGVWKDAAKTSAATTAGDLVYVWADQSGAGNDVIQATSANRPVYQPGVLNSLPVLRFGNAGTAQWLTNAGFSANSQSETICLVYKPYKREVQSLLVYQGASFQFQQSGLGGFMLYDGVSHIPPIQTVSPAREYQVVIFLCNGTTGSIRQNGLWTATATGTLANNTLTGITLASTGSGFALNGDLAEVLIYNAALTGSNLTAVENYLLAKYNLPTPLSTAVPLVVYEGDSITFGSGTSGNEQEWPETTYQGNQGTVVYNYRNLAYPSSTIAAQLTARASYVDSLYSSARGTGKNILVVWAGTNDIWLNSSTASATYSALSAYCAARQAAGWKVIVLTMLPRQSNSANETARQTYNASIRAGYGSFADVLCDVGNDVVLGQSGVQANTLWFNADQIHPNAAGNGIVNTYISSAIAKALGASISRTVKAHNSVRRGRN